MIFYTLLECIVNFTIATCLYHFLYVGGFLDNPSQQTADKVIAALLNLESAKWLIYGTSIFLVVSFVKSFAFHFVEPNIAIFNVPVTTAFRMATLAFAKNSGNRLQTPNSRASATVCFTIKQKENNYVKVKRHYKSL